MNETTMGRRARAWLWLVGAGVAPGLLTVGGCGEARDGIVPNEELWAQGSATVPNEEPLDYRPRSDFSYGLPRQGQPSIQSVIDILLEDEGTTYLAPGDQVTSNYGAFDCSGSNVVLDDRLPVSVEGVVTLHPRQYFKKRICGQDQRFYGSFTLEDDTAAITVLRDSRVAPFTFGDRVRLTVRGMQAGFQGTERVVIAADIEPLSLGGGPVAFKRADASFRNQDPNDQLLAQNFRVEGSVFQKPTNANFNAMVLSNVAWDALPARPAPDAATSAVCVELCRGDCADACPTEGGNVTTPGGESLNLCSDWVCPALCPEGATWDSASDAGQLPSCWQVNIDSELGRRGTLELPLGARAQATGPVVESFGRVMLVLSPGQVEVSEQ